VSLDTLTLLPDSNFVPTSETELDEFCGITTSPRWNVVGSDCARAGIDNQIDNGSAVTARAARSTAVRDRTSVSWVARRGDVSLRASVGHGPDCPISLAVFVAVPWRATDV
jgi:hypothetical protein